MADEEQLICTIIKKATLEKGVKFLQLHQNSLVKGLQREN